MASIPCTAGSSWQKLNLRKGGEKQRLRVAELRRDMALLVANLRILATAVRAGGGTIAFEWPRGCSLWREPVVQAFVEEFQLHKVDFDGCAVGLVHSTTGLPLLKPWRIYTDNRAIVSRLIDRRCVKQHQHGEISGSETAKTASYPKELCILLHEGFTHSSRFELPVVPASFAELTESAKMVISP
jgi:hypothetical protein